MAKLLIVDDDAAFSASLATWLEMQGHRTECAYDGLEGLEKLKSHGYDMAVIDWEMPGITGAELCQKYRSSGGRIPVIMLTARSAVSDKELGLDAGADDYMTKPFDHREFGARIRSLLRRSSGSFVDKLEVGKISLNEGTSSIQIEDRTLKLFRKEYDLLEFLLRHCDRYFSADALLHQVWQSEADVGVEALRVCISRLRKKLDIDKKPSVIENSKGWGYKINEYYLK